MPNTIIFDTLAYTKKLKAAGFTEQQSEVQAEALAEFVSDQLVSRQYFDLRLAELKTDLIKWVLGIAGVQATLIITLLKLL